MTCVFVDVNSFFALLVVVKAAEGRRYGLLLTGLLLTGSFPLTGCWVFGRRVLFRFPGIRDGIHRGSVCVELHCGAIAHQLKILSVQNERSNLIKIRVDSAIRLSLKINV